MRHFGVLLEVAPEQPEREDQIASTETAPTETARRYHLGVTRSRVSSHDSPAELDQTRSEVRPGIIERVVFEFFGQMLEGLIDTIG